MHHDWVISRNRQEIAPLGHAGDTASSGNYRNLLVYYARAVGTRLAGRVLMSSASFSDLNLKLKQANLSLFVVSAYCFCYQVFSIQHPSNGSWVWLESTPSEARVVELSFIIIAVTNPTTHQSLFIKPIQYYGLLRYIYI